METPFILPGSTNNDRINIIQIVTVKVNLKVFQMYFLNIFGKCAIIIAHYGYE